MTVKNPTYPGRQGLMYEEAWALLLCAHWMTVPALYSNVRFQTAPDEAGDDKFFLDDIVFKKSDGSYDLYQIKHKIHPDADKWRWRDFTNPRRNNRNSEFAKWFDSLKRVKRGGADCRGFFLTNGSVDGEVTQYLVTEKINYRSLKDNDASLRKKIENVIEPEKCIEFFNTFSLRFNQNSLDNIENEARTLLCNELFATTSGVNSLILELRKQFAEKQPKPITYGTLREWCEFDIPQPLNQDFEIPDDFQWFDNQVHKELIGKIADLSSGVQVIIGKPGSGKSTYLSKLADDLIYAKTICIRHHYHISPSDPDPIDRLTFERSEKALKAQFNEYSELLGDLQHKNSAEVPLKDYLKNAAEYCNASGKPLILIIDGLDHAMRNNAADDLEKLLKQVCRPQSGIWIILGMQEVAISHLPETVHRACPKSDWIEIEGLSDAGVDAIVCSNQIGLNLPEDDSRLAPLLAWIRNLTQGNPLHLRYTLRQLKLKQGTTEISEYDFRELSRYETNIHNYYSSLWRSIPDTSKSFVLVVQFIDLSLSEDQFFDLAASMVSSPTEITIAYQQIAHLVSRERDGLHLFHASLSQFLKTTGEFNSQQIALLQKVEHWLTDSNYEELKWALLSVLRHKLGDSESILRIDRDWLVSSLARGRSAKAIEQQLTLAHDAAYELKDYALVVRYAYLLNYFLANTDYHNDISEQLWNSAFRYYQSNSLATRITTLSHRKILAVLETAQSENQLDELLDDCIKELNRAHHYYNFKKKGDWVTGPPDLAKSTIDAVTMDPHHELDKIVNYCSQFKDLGWNTDLIAHYAEALCRHGIKNEVISTICKKLQDKELKSFCDRLSFRCIWNGHRKLVSIIAQLQESQITPYGCLLLALSGRAIPNNLSLPEYNRFPDEVDEFDSKGRPDRVKMIRNTFVSALALTISGRIREINDWVSKAPEWWSTQIMAALLRAAIEIAGKKVEEQISYSFIVDQLRSVAPLNWPEDRPRLEWQLSLQDSLGEIFEILAAINRWYGHNLEIVPRLLLNKIPGAYFGKYHLLRFMNKVKITLMRDKDYNSFIESELDEYRHIKYNFPERAQHYLDLYELCMLYSDRVNAGQCLYQAANNLLGYGSHKDPFVWYILESIEVCHQAGTTRALEWLKRIAPVVTNIKQITDGDDVYELPDDFGNLLNSVHSPTLRSWYRFTIENEKFSLAATLFPKLLESLDLNMLGGKAIASTAIDGNSLNVLRRLATRNECAKEVLIDIEDHFGRYSVKERPESTNNELRKPSKEDVAHIEPANVRRYLKENLQPWEQSYFFKPWSQTWLVSGNPKRREAYNALMELIDSNKMYNTPAQLLDELYSFVYEEDRELAFDFLCWAQANDRGWAHRYTEKSRAVNRWQIVKEHFPSRYLEFFEKSVKRTDASKGRDAHFFPIPRGVEFFCRFGNLSTSEAVTDALVQILEDLMANLLLPDDGWLNSVVPDDSEILFLRMNWPSSYVRERTASAIASCIKVEIVESTFRLRLLSYIALRLQNFKLKEWRGVALANWIIDKYVKKRKNIHRLLCNLRQEKLESKIVLHLLPVAKYLDQHCISPRNVFLLFCNQVKVSSPAIDKILSEICNPDASMPPKIPFNEARIQPTSYKTDRFFKRYIVLFLAPYYIHEAERIESDTKFQFTNMWSYEADQLMDDCGIARDVGEAPDFVGGRFTPVISGFSSQISEVYRSAFIRTLNYCFSNNLLDKDTYLGAVFKTMPVELSYWRQKPSRVPDWWPRVILHAGENGKPDSVIGVEVDKEINRICNGIESDLILGMTGPAKHDDEVDTHKHNVRITTIGFAYDTLGPKIPSADTVAEELLYKPCKVIKPSSVKRPFHFLECQDDHVQFPSEQLEIGDLVCKPLVARAHDLTINLWQSYRNFLTFLLVDSLSKDLSLSLVQSRYVYSNDSDLIIASIGDWTNGIGERSQLGITEQFGTYLRCNRQFLQDHLDRNGMRLGYLCQINYSHKKYEYEEPEEYSENRLINVSRIIA